MNTPNCRTCNDSGLIPAEHGCQPCPRCDAYERNSRHREPGSIAAPPPAKPPRITTYFTSDTPQSVPRRPAKSRAHVSPPHSAAVADICDRTEYLHPAYHGEDEDEEPPSDWAEVALYLVAAIAVIIAVGVAYGVIG